MHAIIRRLVLVKGKESVAAVQCSCGDVFKAARGDQAESLQFQHMIEKEQGE